MSRSMLTPAIAAALILTGLGAHGCSKNKAEKNDAVTVRDVPAPAREAISREAGGATIEEYKRIVEDGQTLFIGEFERNGREVEIEVYPDGKVCCVETEMTLADLPAPVRATVEREIGSGKLGEIEEVRSVTKGRTYYAVEADVDGGVLELEVGADGSVIKKELVRKKV
jgi:hypothetical protein